MSMTAFLKEYSSPMTIHGGVLDVPINPIVTTGSKTNKEVINGH